QIDPDDQELIVRQLASAGRGVVVLSGLDSAGFARGKGATEPSMAVRVGTRWLLHVRPDAVPGLAGILAAENIDLARVRADTTPVIRELASLQITLDPRFAASA